MKSIFGTIKSDRLFSKGQNLASKGCLDEALTAFDQALLLNPENSKFWLHKGLMLSNKQQYQAAVNALQKAIDLNPSNPVLYMFLGRVHYDNQCLDKSIAALEKSLSLDSENLFARCLHGLAILSQQYDVEACQGIKKEYLNTNPEFQSRLLLFCETYLKTHPEKAQGSEMPKEDPDAGNGTWQFLDKLIYSIYALNYRIRYSRDADKKSAYLHYLEGVRYSSTNHTPEAVEEFKKSLQLYPDLDDARELLIELYFQSKNFTDVLEYLERKRASKPDDSGKSDSKTPDLDPNAYMLGVAYYYSGRYPEAIEKLNSAIDPGASDYRPFYYLGLCHLTSGNSLDSRMYFRKAVEGMEPSFFKERLEAMIAAYSSIGAPSGKS